MNVKGLAFVLMLSCMGSAAAMEAGAAPRSPYVNKRIADVIAMTCVGVEAFFANEIKHECEMNIARKKREGRSAALSPAASSPSTSPASSPDPSPVPSSGRLSPKSPLAAHSVHVDSLSVLTEGDGDDSSGDEESSSGE
jgi:hypothetical protein